jgi:hypothetical protein
MIMEVMKVSHPFYSSLAPSEVLKPSAPVPVSLSWRRGIPFFPLQRGRDNPLHFPIPLPSPSNPKGYRSLLEGWRGSHRRNHLSRADLGTRKGWREVGGGRLAPAVEPPSTLQGYLPPRRSPASDHGGSRGGRTRRRTHTSRRA